METSIEHANENELIFNNLPAHHRPLFGRARDIDQIEAFLEQRLSSDYETFPPVLMVVHGQKGVGKTTLVRELAWRYVQKNGTGRFKSVLWFDKKRFADLVIGDRSILPDPIAPELHDDLFKVILEKERRGIEGTGLVEILARRLDGDNAYSSNDSDRDSLMALLRYQPFLLVVDDFDEEDFGLGSPVVTERLCAELERVRTPNKVILTSRTDTFPFSERVPQCSVGLLDEPGVFELVRNDCEKHIPRYLWVNEDLEQTAQWVWSVSGGMPHFITKLIFEEAKREERKLGLIVQWSKPFERYTLEYLGAEPTELVRSLSGDQRYLLTALLAQDPPTARKEKELFESIGIVSEDEELADRFQRALITCYRKRLINHRIISDEKKDDTEGQLVWYWTLLPFMRESLREALADYELTQYYEERTKRWIYFFGYHKERHQYSRLTDYLDQGLSALSWCIEHREWSLAIQIGRLIAESMEEFGYSHGNNGNYSVYQQVCNRIAEAAKADGDAQTEIKYKLKLIDPLQLCGASGRSVQQLYQRVEALQSSGRFPAGTEQAHVARLYGKLRALQGNFSDAQLLLEKALADYTSSRSQSDVAWTMLDLAELHLRMGNTSRALDLCRQATQLCSDETNCEIDQETTVKAITISAYVAFLDNRLEESSGLFEQAISLSSKLKMEALVTELVEAKRFVDNTRGSFDPVTAVDGLLTQSFLPIQKDTICTYCRSTADGIRREDIFSGAAWICSGCGTAYHVRCLLEGANRHCLKCHTAYDTSVILGEYTNVCS